MYSMWPRLQHTVHSLFFIRHWKFTLLSSLVMNRYGLTTSSGAACSAFAIGSLSLGSEEMSAMPVSGCVRSAMLTRGDFGGLEMGSRWKWDKFWVLERVLEFIEQGMESAVGSRLLIYVKLYRLHSNLKFNRVEPMLASHIS